MTPVEKKIIATYQTDFHSFNFVKEKTGIICFDIIKNTITGYVLDPSYATIQAVPISIRSSDKKIVKWLLENGFFPEIQENKIVFQFPVSSQSNKLHIENSSQDPENEWQKLLLKTKKDENVEGQIICLEELSKLFIQKKNWVHGAKLLNSALAILSEKQVVSHTEQRLLLQLEEIELLFLQSQSIKVTHYRRGAIAAYRSLLSSLRKSQHEITQLTQELGSLKQELLPHYDNSLDLLINQIMGGGPDQLTYPHLKDTTTNFKQLLRMLIGEGEQLLGPPPESWACIGLGSMARNEMSPYSDIEFAFLIEKNTPKALHYFRTLALFLQIRVINLGETPFPIFNYQYPSPTIDGFCLDSGGNTPLGKSGDNELIGTPDNFIEYLKPKQWKEDIILTNVLSSVCFIHGNNNLVAAYNEKKAAFLNQKHHSFACKNRQKLAMTLLQGSLKEFKPDMSIEKERIKAFGIKQELYRPFQSTIGALALYYGLKSQNIFKIIEEFIELGFFNQKGATHLKEALSYVFSLRYEAHLFYGTEQEYLVHLETEKDPALLYINERYISLLTRIYQTLLPFQKIAEQFLTNQDTEIWSKDFFLSANPSTRGFACNKAFHYREAQQAFQEAVNLEPNKPSLLLELANQESILGNFQHSIVLLKQAIEIQTNPEELATIHNNLGATFLANHQHDEAIASFQMALALDEKNFGEHSRQVGLRKANLSTAYQQTISWEQAKETALSALLLFEEYQDEKGIASVTHCLAGTHYELEEYSSALKFVNTSIEYHKRLYGNPCPQLGQCYTTKGLILSCMGNRPTGIHVSEKALGIVEKFLGKKHHEYCQILNNLGTLYDESGNMQKASQCFEEALSLLKGLKEVPPSMFVAILAHNARAKARMEDIKGALKDCSTCIKLSNQHNLVNSASMVLILTVQGQIFVKAGMIQEARQSFNEALSLALQIYPNNSNPIQTIQNALIIINEQELKINNHFPSLLQTVNDGMSCYEQDRLIEAIQYFEVAVNVLVKKYANQPKKIAQAQLLYYGSRLTADADEIMILCRANTLVKILKTFEEVDSCFKSKK